MMMWSDTSSLLARASASAAVGLVAQVGVLVGANVLHEALGRVLGRALRLDRIIHAVALNLVLVELLDVLVREVRRNLTELALVLALLETAARRLGRLPRGGGDLARKRAAGADDLRDFLTALSAQGFAATTQTRKLSALRQFFQFLYAEGLRGDDSIAELCRKEGIAQSLYYTWSKEFMEAGKRRLAGDTARAATTDEVKDLRREARDLKECVADLTLENRLLKKSMIADGGDDE